MVDRSPASGSSSGRDKSANDATASFATARLAQEPNVFCPTVTEIRPADILFGRGASTTQHPGNVCFRTLVESRKVDYRRANSKPDSHVLKQAIAQEILDEITLRRNGRFVCKVMAISKQGDSVGNEGRSSADCSNSDWVLASPVVVMEKIKQALRETFSCAARAMKKAVSVSLPPSMDSPASLDMAGSFTSVAVMPLPLRVTHAQGRQRLTWSDMASEQALHAVARRLQRERDLRELHYLMAETSELLLLKQLLSKAGPVPDGSPSVATSSARAE